MGKYSFILFNLKLLVASLLENCLVQSASKLLRLLFYLPTWCSVNQIIV